MTHLRRAFVPLTLLIVIAEASPARADMTPEQIDAVQEQADTAMGQHQWKEALPLFSKLYAETKKPDYSWNMAVCWYHLAQNGKAAPDDAIAGFVQYLKTPDLPQERIDDANQHVNDMNLLKTQHEKDHGSTPVPAVTKEAPPPKNDGLRMAAVITGGAGLAALATGGYFSYRAHSLENQVTNAPQFSASDDSSGETAHTLQFVMYGIGGAALVTAGVLYYFAVNNSSEEPHVALIPTIGPGTAGALWSASF
jgi:hypothetical protein